MWMHRHPNVTYLQKFGVQAYVLNQTPNKDKFAPKRRYIHWILKNFQDLSYIGIFQEKSTSRNVKFLWYFPSINQSPGSTTTIEGEIGGNNVSKQVDHHDALPQVESTGNCYNSPQEDTQIQDEHASEENLSDSSIDAGDEMQRASRTNM